MHWVTARETKDIYTRRRRALAAEICAIGDPTTRPESLRQLP